MNIIQALIVNIGIVYLALQVVYKYRLDLVYEGWIDKVNIPILPKAFCQICFLTQCSLITAIIIVPVLGIPMYSIILLALSTPAYTTFLINKNNQ
jgi:hypothetical protein